MLIIQNVSAYFNPIYIVSGYLDGETNTIVTSGSYFPIAYTADDFLSYPTGFIISISGSGINSGYWIRSGVFIDKVSYTYDDLNLYNTGFKNDYINPTLLNGNIFYVNYNIISGGLTGFIKSDPSFVPNRGLIYNTFQSLGTLVSGNLNEYGITTRRDDQYIVINGSSGNFNNDFTFEFWVNQTGYLAPGGSFIIGNSYDSGFAVINNDTGNFIQIFYAGQEIDTDISISGSGWNYLAITRSGNYNPTGYDGSIYINGFGYAFLTNDSHTGITFDFIDISGIGTELMNLQEQDEAFEFFGTTGFTFNFWDMSGITGFWADSNGYISVAENSGSVFSTHQYGTNDGFIQPYSMGIFWADLISDHVYYYEYPDHLIIQYEATLFSEDTPFQRDVYQYALWNDGRIYYYYNVMNGTTDDNHISIGLQQDTGIGLGFTFDPIIGVLHTGLTIEFNPIWELFASSGIFNIITVYNNGIQDNFYIFSGSNSTALNNISCGQDLNTLSNGFNGIFDEIRLWNYARQSGDITNNYNNKIDFYSSGLLYYLSI